MNETRV